MFSKIKKSGIGIRIPITPIWVELQNPNFGPKLEYVFLFYFVFQFCFGASKQVIQNFWNAYSYSARQTGPNGKKKMFVYMNKCCIIA